MVAMLVASIFAVSAWAQEDMTSKIANADLSKTAESEKVWNTDGTKGIADGMVKVASESAFDFSQTITLPAGQYKMTAKAVYRYAGSEAEEFAAIEAGTKTRLVNLYAETATYKYEVGVMNRYDGASDTNFAPDGEKVSTVNGKLVPNSSNAVKAWFDNGMYVNELVFNVKEDGQVKIGLTRTGSISGDYTNIGAWTLTRLGDAEADPKVDEPALEVGDVTNKFLKNADFSEKGSQSGNAINVAPGWTMVHKTGGWLDGFINDEGQYNFWAGQITSLEMYQTVVLPAGKYTISADFFYDATEAYRGVYATAGGLTVESPSAVKDSWNTVSATFENIQEGEVVLGIKSAGWFKADNVRLEYLGELADDAELNAAKTLFTAAYDEFNAAMTACQAIMMLTSFYEVADAADQLNAQIETTTDVDALNTVTEQLKEAVVSLNEINEVYAGYDVFVQKFKAAAEISEPLTTEALELLEYNMYGGAGMQATSIDALKQAILQIQDDYLAYIAGATLLEGGKFDLTYLVQNPNFDKNMDGWQTVNTGHNGGEGYNGVGGIAEIAQWGAESWEASMSQAITGLPNGKYLVKASWMAASGIQMTFAANEGEITVTGIGDNGGNIAKDGTVVEMGQGHRGWQYVEVEGKVVLGKLTITVSSSAQAVHMWSNADAFELYYVGDPGEDFWATEEQKAKFVEALAEAESHVLGFAKDEYAPYTNLEAVKALHDAQAIDLDNASAEGIELVLPALKAAVWTANTEEMSIIYNGSFDVVTEGANYPLGWTRTNGWGQMQTNVTGCDNGTAYYNQPGSMVYGNTGAYIMPLKANAIYKLTFKYRSHEEGAKANKGVVATVALGENSIEVCNAEANPSKTEWKVGEGEFETSEAGNYILTLANSENTWMTDVVLVKVSDVDTGISAPAMQNVETIIYDLQGRRVQKMEKGLYIVNGRKVLVK